MEILKYFEKNDVQIYDNDNNLRHRNDIISDIAKHFCGFEKVVAINNLNNFFQRIA